MRPSEYAAIPQDGDDVFSPTAESSQLVKPEVYYGEGPFDPPSSDDEGDGLLEKNTGEENATDVEQTGLRLGNGNKVSTRSAIVH